MHHLIERIQKPDTMDSISDEFHRMQSTLRGLINRLNQSSNLQQRPDEETLISTSQQMPGAFVFTSTAQPTEQSSSDSSSGSSKIVIAVVTTFSILLLLPFYIMYRVLIYIFFITAAILIKFQRLKYQSLKSTDPVDISRRFIRSFDERIGNTNKAAVDELIYTNSSLIDESGVTEIQRPDFLECAYSHAMLIVKRDVRWLLCYIESAENLDSKRFTKDVLINPKFLNFVKKKHILIWGGDVSETEAFITCNQFSITKLPFLGLMCMTVNQIPTSSGTQQSAPILSLVSKIQGYKDLNTVLKKIDKAYRKYNPTVVRLQNSSSDSDQMTVMAPESIAFEHSVRRDQTRRGAERANTEELQLQWLRWRKSKLLPECTQPGEYSRIAIKLPNGTRKVIKICKTASLEEIYATIECILLHDIEIVEGMNYERPLGFRHEYSFDVYSVFPREYVPCDSGMLISDTSSISSGGNLVVELG